MVVLYVDDFLITDGLDKLFRDAKSTLRNAFSITDLGLLRYFIGLEVNKKYLGIMITLSRYVGDFIKRFHMNYFKATYFPFLSGKKVVLHAWLIVLSTDS